MVSTTLTRNLTRTLTICATLAFSFEPVMAQAQECEAVPVAELSKRIDQARNRIYLVKYDEVKTRLDAIEAQLPCLTEVLSREVLSRIYLYRGVVAFNQSDEAGASAAFRQAVAVDRGSRWDERFGQRPREIFIEAKEAALLAPKGTIVIPELQDSVMIYVDGEPSAAGASFQLPPGEHFMQVRSGDGPLSGVLFKLKSGDSVTPAIPPEYIKAVPDRTSRPGENPRESGTDRGTDRGSDAGRANANASKPETPKPPPKPFDKTKLRPVAYGLIGLGGASLLGGAGGGLVWLQTRGELLKTDENGQSIYYADRESAEKQVLLDKNATAALVTNVGVGLAALLGGSGAALYFLSQGPSPEDALLGFAPQLLPGGMGVSLSGKF